MKDRRWGLVLVVPLLAAIVFSYVRLIAASTDVPADDDYVAARKILDANGFDRAHDALVILPPWSLRPLQVMGDLDPICGDDVADKPMHRWARLWALVEPNADKEHAPLVARRGAPVFSQRAGRVVVERFDLPAPSVLYDLSAHVGDAHVSISGVPCELAIKSGVQCNKDAWQRVDREWLLVTENGDRAVWSHPPPKGKVLEIAWSAVPMGKSVVVEAGFTREGADAATAPVRLRVLVDGALAGTVVRKPAFSFHTDVIDTSRFAGRTAALTFEIDTEDNASAHFAWDATVVGS